MKREDLFYAIEEEASYQKLIDVLRAVVLHKPSPKGRYEKSICVGCSFTETGHLVFYPCRIIQAIEKELK